jgi:hypothetical protein
MYIDYSFSRQRLVSIADYCLALFRLGVTQLPVPEILKQLARCRLSGAARGRDGHGDAAISCPLHQRTTDA